MSESGFREEVRPADAGAVRRLVEATGFFHPEEIDIAQELVDERLAKGEASGYLFLFAEEDGELVGYSCYGIIPLTVASWDLYWIAVHPSRQGTGLGRRLLAATEARIRDAGGGAAYAETSGRPQYEPTRAFYTRCGYDTAAVFPDFYGPDDAKHVFVKRV
jgi:GNAT superfamily N-acetyltransferase